MACFIGMECVHFVALCKGFIRWFVTSMFVSVLVLEKVDTTSTEARIAVQTSVHVYMCLLPVIFCFELLNFDILNV